jgi:hypothetical protein
MGDGAGRQGRNRTPSLAPRPDRYLNFTTLSFAIRVR